MRRLLMAFPALAMMLAGNIVVCGSNEGIISLVGDGQTSSIRGFLNNERRWDCE